MPALAIIALFSFKISNGYKEFLPKMLCDSSFAYVVVLFPVKAHELRSKSRQDLLKDLDDLRNELASLRVAQVTQGTPAKLAKMCGPALLSPLVLHLAEKIVTFLNSMTFSHKFSFFGCSCCFR